MTRAHMQKRLMTAQSEVITLAITQALSKARLEPRNRFAETLLRGLPSDPLHPDAVWIDLAALRDDELALLAEEHV